MVMKDALHEMHITQVFAPIVRSDAAEFNTSFTTTNCDTAGAEGAMFLVVMGTSGATDFVFNLQSDTAATTTANANVATAECRVMTVGGDATTAIVGPVLGPTMAVATAYLFQYSGSARYLRLNASAGTVDAIFGVYFITTHQRREPAHL